MGFEQIGNALRVVTTMSMLGLASSSLSAQTIDEIKAAKPGIERTTLLISSIEASIKDRENRLQTDKEVLQGLKSKVDGGSADQDDKDEYEYLIGRIARTEEELELLGKQLNSLRAALKIFEMTEGKQEKKK